MPLILPIENGDEKRETRRSGSLFVVSTPIGHLEDITYRAVRILGEADLVAAEDTRHSRKLLAHYHISTPLISFHDHNKEKRAPELIARLERGDSVALITDAGTPSISDPGYYLVRSAIDASLPVVPIPGPSAFVTALSVSGLPTDRFFFVGFVPKKTARRRRLLENLRHQEATLVFYESPHRLAALVDELAEALGDREAVMARELTKVYEEIVRGRLTHILQEIAARESLRGECTLLVAGYEEDASIDRETIRRYLTSLGGRKAPVSVSDRVKAVAKQYRIPRKMVYEEALRLEKEGKI